MKNISLNLKTRTLFKKAVSFITAVVMVITLLPLQPMTAYAEDTPEVLWGTSADSLTNSGTWAELSAALSTEKENTSIKYVKANKSNVPVIREVGVYKDLTVDIAGHSLYLSSDGFISAKVSGVTVTVLDTAENDGTLKGDCTRIISIDGTLNLEGGRYENTLTSGTTITSGGAGTCVDISRHPDPEGITINYLMVELSEENFKKQFKLPEGYAWFDSDNNAVTAMKPYGIYTVGKSSEGITYNVTVNYTIGGGDVTAQPSSATEGTTVTISVSPYYNRELVSLKVKQGDTEIPVTDNQFIMPAGDVVIYPEFRVINPTIEVTAADGTVTLTDTFWQAMADVENSTSLDTVVKLLDNITIPEHEHEVSKGVFTFNLNGKTINGGGDEAALDFGVDTKVVITGNGTVKNAVDAIKTASDSLTIENGIFTGTKNAVNICGGNTTINNGTFKVDYNLGSETAVNLTGGKAIINGGSFTSVSTALNIENSEAEAEVNGGTFNAPNAISIYSKGKLSISDNASLNGEYFDINNSSFGTPVIITSEIDANAPISLTTGHLESPLVKGADGITLNQDWFTSASPGDIISYNQTDNTISLKKCIHSWSEDDTCAICGITGYGVYIKGIHINELNAEDVLGDGTVSYNAQTATLTLSGTDISNSDNSHSLEISKGDITLVLIGENSLNAGDEEHFAVWIENGASLTVSENSTGSLTAPTSSKTTENYGYLSQEKIYINRSITGGGDFNVKGGTVSGSFFMGGDIAITGGTVDADYLVAENVTITGGSVTANGKANIEYYDRNAPSGTYGIYADNNILISGGNITTSGGYASVNENALDLTRIPKANATAAMYAGNAIDITGGTVTATGGQWNNYVPNNMGFMEMGNYTENPTDFVKPDTVIDLYGKALKAQSFTISDNVVFTCGSDTTHDMQYCAGDAEHTIACKCVFCGKAVENITATVNAEDVVYNGSAYDKASIVYGDSWNSSKDLVITYTGTTFGGEDYNSTTAPTDAGEYTASVTVNGVTAFDKFEISRAEPEADMFTVTYPSNLVYDGTAKIVTAAVKDGYTGVGEILVKYYDENYNLVPEAVNAGKCTVKLSIGEGENYTATQEPIFPTDGSIWEFEITKATAAATQAPSASELTYDGTAQALVTAGTTDDGKFVYSLSEDGQYSETIPTGITAGEYMVWYYVQGDNNHDDSAKSFVKVVIAKADQQIEIKDIPDTVTYGDAFKLSAQLGEGSMGTSWSIESGADNATTDPNGNITVTGAGEFTVTLTSYGKQNYNDKTVSHTFTARKRQLTVVEAIAEDKYYDGETDTLIEEITLRGIVNEDSIVALGTAQFTDKNAGVSKPVTITDLTLRGHAAENYILDVNTVETTADINPAAITVTVDAGQSKVYGTADSEFAYEITSGLLYGDDKLTGAIGREEGETAGEYAYTIGTLGNPNYDIRLAATDRFVIDKALPDLTGVTATIPANSTVITDIFFTGASVPGNYSDLFPSELVWGDNEIQFLFTPDDSVNYAPHIGTATVTVTDTAAPTGTIRVELNSWTELLNNITFNLFFNKTVDVYIYGADELSGVKSVEYTESDTQLTAADFASADWKPMQNSKVSVTAEEAKLFVYYARITDNAGNLTVISSDGMIFDLTPPVITGISDGADIYVTTAFDVTDDSPVSVTVNGGEETQYLLSGNMDYSYVITATDAAGNETTITVIVHSVNDLNPANEIAIDKVTADDSACLDEMEALINAMDTTSATDAEKYGLQSVKNNIDILRETIESTADVIEKNDSRLENMTGDNVTSDYEPVITGVIDSANNLLNSDNLTSAQRTQVEQQLVKAQQLKEKIAADKEALAEATDSVPDVDTDKVTAEDAEDLVAAKEKLKDIVNSNNYTVNEKATAREQLEKVEELEKVIEETGTAVDKAVAEEGYADKTEADITSAENDEIEENVEAIEELLDTDNLTDEQREALEDTKTEAEKLLAEIKENSEALDNALKAEEDTTEDNYQLSDKEDLKEAVETLKAVTDESNKNYTAEEKQTAQEELDRIETIIADIEETETVIADITEAVEKVAAITDEKAIPDNEEAVDAVIVAQGDYNNLTGRQKELVSDTLKQNINDALTKITAYEIIHGADGKWTEGSSKTLGFTANGLFKLFEEVRVDGNILVKDTDYTAISGSTIVTLSKSYLDTLSVDKHKLEVVYDVLGEEHIADCEFTINAKPASTTQATPAPTDNVPKTEDNATPAPTDNVPKTGDNTNTVHWMVIMLSSMAALAVVFKKKKEYKVR